MDPKDYSYEVLDKYLRNSHDDIDYAFLSNHLEVLYQECCRLEKFIEQAFQAHPNLDIDIEYENERT